MISLILQRTSPLPQLLPILTIVLNPKPFHTNRAFLLRLNRRVGIAHQALPQEINAMPDVCRRYCHYRA